MARPFRSILPIVLYAAAAFLFGAALGERGELGIVQFVFLAAIPLASAVLFAVARRGRANILLTGTVMCCGLLLGQHHFRAGWADCTREGESVRQAILSYYDREGDWPVRIEDLRLAAMPCRAGFRPTVLHYYANDRGFHIWMSNDRERWVATAAEPFTATGRSSAPPRTQAGPTPRERASAAPPAGR